MKSNVILKTVLALVAIVCVCMGAMASGHTDQTALTAFAAAPAIAAFNFDNLKITADEFKALQAKHGRLYVLDITIDEVEKYQFIVCRPSRDVMDAITANRNDLSKANNIIIKNMIVGGDTDALKDGVVYARAMAEIGKIVQQGQSFLSKA